MAIGKRYFTVEDRIFRHLVHVLLNHSDAELQNVAKANRWDMNMGCGIRAGYSVAFTMDGRYDEWVIVLREFNWTICDMSTLIHEIHHTVVNIMELHGVKIGGDTQEFSALMEGAMFEEIARKIHKLKRVKV